MLHLLKPLFYIRKLFDVDGSTFTADTPYVKWDVATSKFKGAAAGGGGGGDDSLLVHKAGAETIAGQKTFGTEIVLTEIATPGTPPAASKHAIYPKSDGKLYHLNHAGIEVEIGAGSGGGAADVKVIVVTANATSDGTEDVILVNASETVSITLPVVDAATRLVRVKNVSGNTVNVLPSGSDTIETGSFIVIQEKWVSLTFAPLKSSDGWYLV